MVETGLLHWMGEEPVGSGCCQSAISPNARFQRGAYFRRHCCVRLLAGTKRMLGRWVTRLAEAGAHCNFHVEVLTRSCSIQTEVLFSVYAVRGNL